MINLRSFVKTLAIAPLVGFVWKPNVSTDGIFRTKRKEFHIGCKKGRFSFVAWAKHGEILGPDAVREPGDPVYFHFGDSIDDAINNLTRCLPPCPNTPSTK